MNEREQQWQHHSSSNDEGVWKCVWTTFDAPVDAQNIGWINEFRFSVRANDMETHSRICVCVCVRVYILAVDGSTEANERIGNVRACICALDECQTNHFIKRMLPQKHSACYSEQWTVSMIWQLSATGFLFVVVFFLFEIIYTHTYIILYFVAETYTLTTNASITEILRSMLFILNGSDGSVVFNPYVVPQSTAFHVNWTKSGTPMANSKKDNSQHRRNGNLFSLSRSKAALSFLRRYSNDLSQLTS